MKIIINEGKAERIKELINTKGLNKVSNMMGGFSNLVKLMGFNSVSEYIYNYLDEHCTPYGGWDGPDDYDDEINRNGEISFPIGERFRYGFDYFLYDNDDSKVNIRSWLWNELEEVFEVDGRDDFDWKDVFKRWFQDHTKLTVDWVE